MNLYFTSWLVASSLLILSASAQNPSILEDSRVHPTSDGSFGFLYRTQDGIAHAAKGDPGGAVHGRFTYTDPTGLKVNFNYNAGAQAIKEKAQPQAQPAYQPQQQYRQPEPQPQYREPQQQYREPQPQYQQPEQPQYEDQNRYTQAQYDDQYNQPQYEPQPQRYEQPQRFAPPRYRPRAPVRNDIYEDQNQRY